MSAAAAWGGIGGVVYALFAYLTWVTFGRDFVWSRWVRVGAALCWPVTWCAVAAVGLALTVADAWLARRWRGR